MRYRLTPRLQWSGSKSTCLLFWKAYTCTWHQLSPRCSYVIWCYSHEDSECHARIVNINLTPSDWEGWSHTFLWFISHYCKTELQIILYLKTREMNLSPWLSFWIKSRSSNLLNFTYCTKKKKKENKTLDTFLTVTKGEKQELFLLSLFVVCRFWGFCFFYSSAWERSFSQKKVEMEEAGCNSLLYFCAPYNLPRKTLFRGNGSMTSNFGSSKKLRLF